MNPAYLDLFLAKYAPRQADVNSSLPLTVDQLTQLAKSVRKVGGDLHLAKLTSAQRVGLGKAIPANLRKLALLYAQLFRRRPDIAKALGISQDLLDELLQREITLGALAHVALELVALAKDGKLLLTAAVAEANKHVDDTAAQLKDDPSLTPDQRQGVNAAIDTIDSTQTAQKQKKKASKQKSARTKKGLLKQQQQAQAPLVRAQAVRELVSDKAK